MESRPNFSLGLSQLDAQEQNISVVGFVPGTFDYEKLNFAENRSQHRNDSVTMKKLKEVASSSSKKSASKSTSRKKFSYKNLQPTSKEVQRLNLSFTEDFEICDRLSTSVATTFVDRKFKRSADEDQLSVITVAENFDDFSIIPPQKILIKASLSSPLSAEQACKRRNIVMFEEESLGVKDDENSTRARSRDQVKSVPSSTTMSQGTSKLTLDMDEIKTYINYYDEKMVDKEEGREEESKKTGQYIYGGFADTFFFKYMDSIQDVVDAHLFGLSKSSTTIIGYWDCGIFVDAYAEILSEGLKVHSCGFDVESQRARYASLLWHYGVTKTKEGYSSDNGDPSRPINSILQSIDESAMLL
ncbi:hypothetical protein FXO38_23410 [Capsicum annuum]|nr:hypothetical protein FXO38_23410 [Capsicum annuum]KAF3641098.1 hypothetical protein FXO37_23169 [Capsicum annuum]